jgi:hypothetical protein
VNAARFIFIEDKEVVKEQEKITAPEDVPDGLNANRCARLIHCVFENQAPGIKHVNPNKV